MSFFSFSFSHRARQRARPTRAVAQPLLLTLLVLLFALCAPRCFAEECVGLDCYTAPQRDNTRAFLQTLGASLGQSTWSGSDFCLWSGVYCEAPGVTVFIGSSDVAGTLPELSADVDGTQVQLFRLDVSNNPSITGTLPHSWGGLTQLAEFVVTMTSMSGTIPSEYTGMSSLTDFLIFATDITGTLPSSWAAMRGLQHFAAQDTQVSGSIPTEWHQVPTLEHFLLQNTPLSGTLPAAWGTLTNMEFFAVLSTSVTGTLPPEWGDWSNVLAVRVENTQVSGTLPPQWSGMTSILEFSAKNTQLTGTIPDSWGNMSSLKSVTLPDTDVTCCLPYAWVCSKSLTATDVGLTSHASSSCPSKEELCSKPESSYTSSCPAYTTTTRLPSSNESDGTSTSKFPWWAILIIVLVAVAIIVAVLLVVWCCCGCGCVCCPQRESAPDKDVAAEESELQQYDTEDRMSASFVVDSEASVASVESAASVASVHTQPAAKMNPFALQQSFAPSDGNALEAAAAANCQADTEDDVVIPFNEHR